MSANVKEKAKEARNGLQQGIYVVINPFEIGRASCRERV